jgi:hypothetical protein
MKTETCRKNSLTFLAKFLPALLLGVPTGYFKRALVDESGMIRTQMWTHNRLEIGRSVWGALYDTTP